MVLVDLGVNDPILDFSIFCVLRQWIDNLLRYPGAVLGRVGFAAQRMVAVGFL